MAIILDADLVIRGEKGAFDLEKWVACNGGQTERKFAKSVCVALHYLKQ